MVGGWVVQGFILFVGYEEYVFYMFVQCCDFCIGQLDLMIQQYLVDVG